jgi:hypothetical protein
MPSEGLASPYLAKFAPHERPSRVEPELGPSTEPRTAYPTVTSDSPTTAEPSSVVQTSIRSRGCLNLSPDKHS